MTNLRIRSRISALPALLATIALSACSGGSGDSSSKSETRVRLGYFPNVTHAQALVGVARGDFAKALEGHAKFEASSYNAGPSVIEAIFAGHLDMAYVGPSPTINGFQQSQGREVRLVAGSALNGVLIVGNAKRGIESLEELRGKTVATPQLANTQDISAKHYLQHALGATFSEKGGDTTVIPMANPDIETLFIKDQLDAAWVPEPWGSRMIHSGLVTLIAEEKDLWESGTFALTGVIARARFLEEHPDLVERVLRVHVALTAEVQRDGTQLVDLMNGQIKTVTGKELDRDVLIKSFDYVQFTTEPDAASILRFFQKGKELGLVRGESLDTATLLQLDILHVITGAGAGPAAVSAASDTETTAP